MKKSVYIESSIPSYLTARLSRDIRTAGWQQVTMQWWDECRCEYDLFTSELVIAEISAGDEEAVERRLRAMDGINELPIDDAVETLAEELIKRGALPNTAQADAIHISVAAIQEIDYLLTWNCRHINNAAMKPAMRTACADLGCCCPEICTPLELLGKESGDV
ncbi:type II toxin-antitoxin system VapC family toxin [Candidatus Sumerlaeota bacterium]|nr:type II toxin-antitoxin system VapC family toxin [Candidatus Sumerlaeota bacterium]